MTASAWTEDRIGLLKTLWLEGRSASQIAQALANGITRNAVLGKVHRMGLSVGRTSDDPPEACPTPRQRGGPRPARPLRPPSASVNRARALDAAPGYGLASLLSVRRCDCRWPFGDPRAANFSLCGRPVERGAFCGPHAAIAYRRAPDTPRSLARLARLN